MVDYSKGKLLQGFKKKIWICFWEKEVGMRWQEDAVWSFGPDALEGNFWKTNPSERHHLHQHIFCQIMLFPRIHPQTQHTDPRDRELPLIQTGYESGSSYRHGVSPSRLRSSTYSLATEEQEVTTTISSLPWLDTFYYWQILGNGKINLMWPDSILVISQC